LTALGPHAASVLAFLLSVVLLAPPGFAVMRACGQPLRLACLGTAMALGTAVVLPLLVLETALGGPYLVLPVVVASLVWVRPARLDRADLPPPWACLGVPLALVLLAATVNGSDAVLSSHGLGIRFGFDVVDRLFYGTIGQELLRAPITGAMNPLFADVPLQAPIFPSLFGVLLQRYGGASLIAASMYLTPAVLLGLTSLALLGLLRELRVPIAVTWPLVSLLMALGGDLSFLARTMEVVGPERTRHILAFYSFAAESLYYNTWMLGLPLVVAALTLARRWLANGGAGTLAAAGLVLGALWPTKVFACLGLVGGSLLYGALRGRWRAVALAACGAACAAPWAALTALAGGARRDPPLALEPLVHVKIAASVNPLLAATESALSAAHSPQVVTAAAVVLLFLAGGMGARLAGGGRLWRLARTDETGFHAWLVVTLGWLVVLSLLLVASPNAIDGIQFLTLAQYLAWIPAAIVIGELATAGGGRRLAALGLVAIALPGPVRYVVLKTLPDRFCAAGSPDRERVVIGPADITACQWLARHSGPTDVLAYPVGNASFAVGVVCDRRLAAAPGYFHVDRRQADERRVALAAVYSGADRRAVEEGLSRLGADWVWEDASHPLPFPASGLTLRYAQGPVRIHRYVSPPPPTVP
jgi:hypothetical protein